MPPCAPTPPERRLTPALANLRGEPILWILQERTLSFACGEHRRIRSFFFPIHIIRLYLKKFKTTTDSKHHLPVAENLLEQKFSVSVPSTVWGTDITYVPTDEGRMYLAGVKDFAGREIHGYAMGSRMSTELTRAALRKAVRFRKPLPGCIHHSDWGSQYCASDYRKEVETAGMIASMSRKGNYNDNAPTESFWGHLKQQLIHQRHFGTRGQAMAAIQEYIEIFYNRMRLHSALGNMTPSVYAEQYFSQRRIA